MNATMIAPIKSLVKKAARLPESLPGLRAIEGIGNADPGLF
jgi:hypothetical protein